MPLSPESLTELDQALGAEPSCDDANLGRLLGIASGSIKESLKLGSAAAADEVAKIVGSLRKMRGALFAEERINTLIDAAHYFYVIGQPFSSIEPARAAVQVAELTSLKPLHRKALTMFGAMSADTGNISQAIEAYSKALELADSLGDRDAKCIVWVNLGVAMLNCAQYRDAIVCFETAIDLAEGHPHLAGHRLTALSNIALCSLHLEDYARGLRAAGAVAC